MKIYEKPQLLLEKFETEDIIMESGIFTGIVDNTAFTIQQSEKFNSLQWDVEP
ncbi:MAG: hypothetical protein IK057_00955 [Clostridia bacterium]|nr:hypothetical protein [Clostridia bacterium]